MQWYLLLMNGFGNLFKTQLPGCDVLLTKSVSLYIYFFTYKFTFLWSTNHNHAVIFFFFYFKEFPSQDYFQHFFSFLAIDHQRDRKNRWGEVLAYIWIGGLMEPTAWRGNRTMAGIEGRTQNNINKRTIVRRELNINKFFPYASR